MRVHLHSDSCLECCGWPAGRAGRHVMHSWLGDTQAKKEPTNGKGDIKWATLEHHGVVFPPEYEPHGVPLMYDGEEVQLKPEQVWDSGATVRGHTRPASGAKVVGARRTGC